MFTLFSVILLGFFLGIRHATDADHVVAVTTIVSRERSIRSAAWIGAVSGFGHTLTIMAVGGAIILFGLTATRSTVFHHRLGLASGFLSVGFGLFMVFEIGFVQGLFTK